MSQNPPNSDSTIAVESPDAPQEPYWRRLYSNSRAFILRSFALVCVPRRFAPLIGDFWLLLQSTWRGKQWGKQWGPELVYPMLSIRMRQSGRLAKLILEHCKTVPQYPLRAATPFPRGIDPPRVAVVDLDEVPQEVIAKGYSTQLDVHGLMCMLMLFETTIMFIAHVFFLSDWGPVAVVLFWVYYAYSILTSCLTAVLAGNGTLTLARRSDISTPGCAILREQDFTVVLSGNQNVVEAIAESGFNLSHSNSVWNLKSMRGSDRLLDYPLETLCEAACVTLLELFFLLFHPSTVELHILLVVGIFIVAWLLRMFPANQVSLPRRAWFAATELHYLVSPPVLLFGIYMKVATLGYILQFFIYSSLFLFFFYPRDWDGNYPIRSARFLDALGHPPVMKWEFDSHAASVTFQCLVLCRGIPRPIRSIDVLALLDLLIPDQRDLWKAWKERVADRIVHEKDILFAPTIPTFADERQQQLKDHLDQAQFGYDTYMDSYSRRVPLYPVT